MASKKKAVKKQAVNKKTAKKTATKKTTKKKTAKKAAPKKTTPKKKALRNSKELSVTKASPPMSFPPVGTVAPSFSCVSDAESVVTLSALKGKPVVLYFYPKDSTPGCTIEACDFRDSMNRVAAAGADGDDWGGAAERDCAADAPAEAARDDGDGGWFVWVLSGRARYGGALQAAAGDCGGQRRRLGPGTRTTG